MRAGQRRDGSKRRPRSSIPATACSTYGADGREHTETGKPSTAAADHAAQLDKRLKKIEQFDYGDHWADVRGTGRTAYEKKIEGPFAPGKDSTTFVRLPPYVSRVYFSKQTGAAELKVVAARF